jgi:hypothetical protein
MTTETQPVATIETVTPELAAEWMLGNTHNRTLKTTAVAKYAADMSAGVWDLNGESIKFNGDGRLLDGQNRLAAVIESGVTIQTVVVRGVAAEGQETIDVGSLRGLADVLKLRGEINCSELASGITTLWRYLRDPEAMSERAMPSRHQGLAVLAEHPGLRDSARETGRVKSAIGFRGSVAVALHHLTTSLDEGDAAFFWERLTDGVGLAPDSPILLLRNQIIADRGAMQKMPRIRAWATAGKAWNYYRDGRGIKVLKWSPGGASPEKCPVLR